LSSALRKVDGTLVQAEDELASINMAIGAAYGGTPALTATSGPGLALMTEAIGLASAAEVPVVVVDVMRAGPSTGIPTKSEQGDLNLAVYGLHGDAPHVVVAPLSVADCLFATQWAVHLAESLQLPAIVLSDQFLGQAHMVIDQPANIAFATRRETTSSIEDSERYQRYSMTPTGVSPMAIPGTPRGQYTADGLEHNQFGTPSSQAEDHLAQSDKRQAKLDNFDFGGHWAELEGAGDLAIITWGSSTGPAREALVRAQNDGVSTRLIALRMILPAQPEKMMAALEGVSRVLVVDQSHSGQFYRFLRAHYDLPGDIRDFHRAGPLRISATEIMNQIEEWDQ
jgi:2-oxoglutarate ferredoxin oxidoreductase subunit alpha